MTDLSEQQTRSTFYRILIEALQVSPSKLTPAARLFDDLGAESIDVLDIQFRIQRAFGLQIEQDELLRSLGEGLSAEEIQQKLTVGWCLDYIRNRLRQAADAP